MLAAYPRESNNSQPPDQKVQPIIKSVLFRSALEGARVNWLIELPGILEHPVDERPLFRDPTASLEIERGSGVNETKFTRWCSRLATFMGNSVILDDRANSLHPRPSGG